MTYNVPQLGEITINTIVLDLNGTLAVKGKIVDGAKERIAKLKELGFKIILFTGDQRGNAKELCEDLGIDFMKAGSGLDKETLFLDLELETTAAIGNARIDLGKFKHAKVSVATLQSEGIHTGILKDVDVIVPSINDALDFFIDADIFCATMRV